MKRWVVAGLLVVAVSACSAPAPPRADITPSPKVTPSGVATLPAPTGTHAVGTTSLYVKDTSRPDPWEPDAAARQLKVTLWYPAKSGQGQRAPYMTAKESELVLKGKRLGTSAQWDVLSKTETNAVKDADPAGARGALPLVVLSPGWTNVVSSLTSLAEELASRGYVVAGVDHLYENYATTLADGTVAECVACDFDSDPGFQTRVVESRADDVSFVLNRLTRSAWKGSKLIDASKIAMVGQSLGGASALAAMGKDSRIRAGINMDGTTYYRIPKTGMSRPFLFLSSPGHVPGGGDNSWDRDWRLLTGWKRWLMFSGGEHQSFTDVGLMGGALGVRPAKTVTLTADRASELTRAYVTAFLDHHLLGKSDALLDKPPPEFSEVKLCSVETKSCR